MASKNKDLHPGPQCQKSPDPSGHIAPAEQHRCKDSRGRGRGSQPSSAREEAGRGKRRSCTPHACPGT